MFNLISKESVRTCLLSGAAIGMLFTAVSAYAVTAHQPAPPPKRPLFDNLLRQDNALGALRTELMTRQSQGANASSLLGWLRDGGFNCEASLAEPGTYDCVYRRHLTFDRVAELQARIVTSGTALNAVLLPPQPLPSEPSQRTALLAHSQRGG
jgi:hypothetical protein